MKSDRQKKILDLIAVHDINTQEELIDRLRAAGFSVTQATISRDIRELKLVKTMTSGGFYKYTQANTYESAAPKFNSAVAEAVISVDYSGNIVVIHTYPGMAQPVASCVDAISHDEILGCVGGDDTVMVVIRAESSAANICERIRRLMVTI